MYIFHSNYLYSYKVPIKTIEFINIYILLEHIQYAYKYQVHVGSSFNYSIPKTCTYSRPINSYTFYMYLYNVYHYI